MGRSTSVVSDHQYSISKAYHPLGEAKEVQTPQCGYPGLPPPELGTKVQTPRYGYTGLLPPVLGNQGTNPSIRLYGPTTPRTRLGRLTTLYRENHIHVSISSLFQYLYNHPTHRTYIGPSIS